MNKNFQTKKFQTADITIIALCVALLMAFGGICYYASTIIAIPASRVVFTTPLFCFVYTLAIMKTKKIGTLSLIAICYSLLLIRFSIFSFLAIGSAALLSDVVSYVLIGSYQSLSDIYRTVPLANFFATWTSYVIVRLFLPASTFMQEGFLVTLFISIVIYGLGFVTSRFTLRLMERRGIVYELAE